MTLAMEQATAIAAASPVLQSSQITEIADSISCGVCDEKFYHVSNFLKHKSSCVGEAEKPSEESPTKCESSASSSSAENSPTPGKFLCQACPNLVFPSLDLLRLHLLDSHRVYLPAGVDLSSMLQETKAFQVHPDTAKKIASLCSKKNNFDETTSDGNSELSERDELDSGNDSEHKKDISGQDLSVSPGGGKSSTEGTDSGNHELRSPEAATDVIKPSLPNMPQIPSQLTRNFLENLVASRLRANLEQQQKINSENKPSGLPLPNPFVQATNPLNGAPLIPFRLPFAGLPQANSAATLNFNSSFAQQAQAQAQAQLAQQSPQPLSVIGQTRPADSNTLYQPAVKRRRRGYGSEVGTENLRIERDGDGYKCPLCNYKSRVRSNLTIHLRTHTGYKPYKCPYCPYSSSQSGPLKIHIRGHTGEKPYRCEYCSYASTCRGNLKVHQERHHKEEILKYGMNAGIRGPGQENTSPKGNDAFPALTGSLSAGEEAKTSSPSSPISKPFTPTSVPNFVPTSIPTSNPMMPNPLSQFTGFPPVSSAAPFMNHFNPSGLLNILSQQRAAAGAHHFPLNLPQPPTSESEGAQVSEIEEDISLDEEVNVEPTAAPISTEVKVEHQ